MIIITIVGFYLPLIQFVNGTYAFSSFALIIVTCSEEFNIAVLRLTEKILAR